MDNKIPNTDVISFEEVTLIENIFQIDYEKMIKNLIANKLRKIYEVLGWNFDRVEITTQKKLSIF